MRPLLVPGLLLALCCAAPTARGANGYDNCTGFIDALPAEISTQGVWCLRQDVSTGLAGGVAIEIAANNVTIDCNEFKVGGLSAGTSTGTYGIHAANRLNVTVRGCNIRGFFRGVYLTGTGGGHVVEDSRFDNNTQGGIWVEGDGSVIRRNVVVDTVGSPLVPGTAFGIFTAYSVDVFDNTISGVTPIADGSGTGYGTGIHTTDNTSSMIADNRVRGVTKTGGGVAFGIVNVDSGRVSLVGNQVVGDSTAGTTGVFCHNMLGHAVDNIVNSFATSIDGCHGTDNEVLP